MANERNQKHLGDLSGDVNELVQHVLREAYLAQTEDLRFFAEKVRYVTKLKKAIREYLSALREFKADALATARERGVDLCRADKNDMAVLKEVFEQHARANDLDEIEYELGIPDRVPATTVTNFALLDGEIARWEEKLNTVGDDAQLANVDL